MSPNQPQAPGRRIEIEGETIYEEMDRRAVTRKATGKAPGAPRTPHERAVRPSAGPEVEQARNGALGASGKGLDPVAAGIDFEADGREEVQSPTDLKNLALVAARLLKAKEKLAWYENKAEEAKKEVRQLEEVELPDTMDAAGVSRFETSEGAGIVIKRIVAGSIKEVNRAEAFAWLRSHEYGHLIKQETKVVLPRGKELPPQVVKTLEKIGAEVSQKEAVNPQTLGAWARECIEAGIKLPLDLLGVYVGRRATVEAKAAETKNQEKNNGNATAGTRRSR